MFDEIQQEMLGTFAIYLSSVSQRTNGIMKTLTIISILVLPAHAILAFSTPILCNSRFTVLSASW